MNRSVTRNFRLLWVSQSIICSSPKMFFLKRLPKGCQLLSEHVVFCLHSSGLVEILLVFPVPYPFHASGHFPCVRPDEACRHAMKHFGVCHLLLRNLIIKEKGSRRMDESRKDSVFFKAVPLIDILFLTYLRDG